MRTDTVPRAFGNTARREFRELVSRGDSERGEQQIPRRPLRPREVDYAAHDDEIDRELAAAKRVEQRGVVFQPGDECLARGFEVFGFFQFKGAELRREPVA